MAATIRIGTRASQLAHWQANWVAKQLEAAGYGVQLVPIKTQGDVRPESPIGALGDVGVFTREIQRSLLEDSIDVAVHSLKDLPTESVPGLVLGAVPTREKPSDALISRSGQTLMDLPEGATVGTGSLRRRAQLLHLRPDLVMRDIRGNVETRLRKLDEGSFDAIVLAVAGLIRLDLEPRITQVFASDEMLPAVGQGALGLEVRQGDSTTLSAVAALDDAQTRAAVMAERALLAALRGGCLAPVGAWGRFNSGDALRLEAVVLSPDGKQRLFASETEIGDNAEKLGHRVAELLLAQGAQSLIEQSRRA